LYVDSLQATRVTICSSSPAPPRPGFVYFSQSSSFSSSSTSSSHSPLFKRLVQLFIKTTIHLSLIAPNSPRLLTLSLLSHSIQSQLVRTTAIFFCSHVLHHLCLFSMTFRGALGSIFLSYSSFAFFLSLSLSLSVTFDSTAPHSWPHLQPEHAWAAACCDPCHKHNLQITLIAPL
jgi:hypothetical protein